MIHFLYPGSKMVINQFSHNDYSVQHRNSGVSIANCDTRAEAEKVIEILDELEKHVNAFNEATK